MSVDHYENFPVASWLLPPSLREPVTAIYAFARSADDIADEGTLSPDLRIAQLQTYQQQLNLIETGQTATHPIFVRLAKNIADYNLPISLLRDLLDAFEQDVHTTRYESFEVLLDYCRRSANPVGRLMLRLYRQESALDLEQSDAICTALQLINHWQDAAIDWQKNAPHGRVYLPQDDMHRFGVEPLHFTEQRCDAAWQDLMRFQCDRARSLILQGAPLARRLPGRIGWELRMVVGGGLRILDRLATVRYDVFRHRPTLGLTDWPRIVWQSAVLYPSHAD